VTSCTSEFDDASNALNILQLFYNGRANLAAPAANDIRA
jgi:hypothetical protein